MKDTVEVALVGQKEHAFSAGAITWEADGQPPEFLTPWEQRERVTLEVSRAESLGEILRRAATEFGIELPPPDVPAFGFCAFYVDDAPGGFAGLKRDWPLADDQGRVVWGTSLWTDTAFAEVLHAADTKVLHGDPRRLYLILLPPSGDGIMLGWSQLLEALRLAYMALEGIATVGGVAAFGKLVYDAATDRLRRGRDAIEDHYPGWQERGAVPMRLDVYLMDRTWHVADLASTLGCEEDVARAILEAWGFAESPQTGLWRLEGDEPAKLVRGLHRELITSIAYPAVDPFERAFRQRALEFAQTGEHPPPPREPDYQDEDDEEWENDALDGARVECACGRDDCEAELRVSRVWDQTSDGSRLRLRIENFEDHFDLTPQAFGLILGTLAT